MEPSRSEPAGIHFMGGADRLFTGLMLAKKGKGKVLVMGGGSFKTTSGIESEADAVKTWVEEWHLSPVPVQSLGSCTDTHDEAVKVSALVVKHGWKRVALVTSAYHMTRSRAVFETAGTAVVPVPCNYLSAALRDHRVNWVEVPNAANLGHFEAWMHEIIGWWAYRLCGWV
ncbi:MAG: YdcF family protein [Prosthecobacter sp.]|nr:YdcF family protein [Prosthecobacter sp.]